VSVEGGGGKNKEKRAIPVGERIVSILIPDTVATIKKERKKEKGGEKGGTPPSPACP